jgi:hypothetical protein
MDSAGIAFVVFFTCLLFDDKRKTDLMMLLQTIKK